MYSLVRGAQLVLTVPNSRNLDTAVMDNVRSEIRTILRKEAKAHLPRRIDYIASHRKFYLFRTLRFTHAGSRWGSCNHKSNKFKHCTNEFTVRAIDYVLIQASVSSILFI